MAIFIHKNISQVSVATRLRCGGIFSNHWLYYKFTNDFTGKKLCKSVKNWRCYCYEFDVFLFWDTVYNMTFTLLKY